MVFRGLVALCALLVLTAAQAQAEKPIPRSVAGDKGKYFLIEHKRKGDIVQALHKRVGVDSLVFTRTETNCKTMQMREMGVKDDTPTGMKISPSKWLDLVPGSSKSDVARFVCNL